MTPDRIPSFLRAQAPLFAPFPQNRLAELVAGSVVESFQPGQFVARQGDAASHLGVLLEGALAASVTEDQGGGQFLGELRPGETYGEMALMTGDPMPADIVAREASEVMRIPVSLFQSVVVTEPAAVQELSRTIARRMQSIAADPAKATAVFRPKADPYGLDLQGGRPERILVINCGSSSLKYGFHDTADAARHVRGQVERIGIEGTRLVQRGPGRPLERDLPRAGYAEAFQAMMESLAAGDAGAGEFTVVAHRVVHGGEAFPDATIITDEVLARLEALNPLAPLHNPVNVAGIREMRRLLPAVPHVAVFDTSFHHTLPPHAYLYGLPYELYAEQGVRRYGFHGTSHHYASLRAAQFLQRRPHELRVISCHLGNGSSLCAVDHGRSVDTSMGFTPGEGLIMGTRCGDVDAGVLAFLERTRGSSAVQSEELLNRRSGLLGLSGVSSDMREILEAAGSGHARALLALHAYAYRVRKYLGAYVAAMGGVDAVVFTGGIGEGSEAVRALALQGLDSMGVVLEEARNREAHGLDQIRRISADHSKVAVLVVPADEERMMAREALRTLGRSAVGRALAARRPEPFLVEVSAHHVHLTQEHVEALFGPGHQLTRQADLSQPGQYACREQVTLVGPKGRIERVRVLGPVRNYTQVEIALTEQFKLGVQPPIRESGDLAGTPGCLLEGPAGQVRIERGVICALRHIHMTPADALRFGVRDKAVVRVRVEGDRELVFGDVLVRVDPNFALAMHLDTDEANAANVQTGARGGIVGIQSEG